MSDPLTTEEAEQIANLVEALGEDCLVITPREFGEKLGLDPTGLRAHLKQYFVSHNFRRVLRGEEKLNAGVLILYVPPDYSGPGGLFLLSCRPEYEADYKKFRTVPAARVQ